MSAFVKKYPRAKVSRHPMINGWVIDLIQRDGARPRRVAATYVSAAFAGRAALVKLGIKNLPSLPQRPATVAPIEAPVPAAPRPVPAVPVTVAPGKCIPCGRPMRPAGAKAADHPGTTLRQREGLCQVCCQKALRQRAAA